MIDERIEYIDFDELNEELSEIGEYIIQDDYDAAELKAKKDAIFSREEYAVLVDDESFKSLVADAEKFSVEEVESKTKAIFADYVIKTGEFSSKKDEGAKKPNTVGLNFNAKAKKAGPYGNLFNS